MFLHPVGSADHVVHSGVSGLRNVDALFFHTRALAHQLNNQVSSFLASYSSYLDNGNMRSILLLMNDGQEGNGVPFALVTFGFQYSRKL
jgi:hypothetical protein